MRCGADLTFFPLLSCFANEDTIPRDRRASRLLFLGTPLSDLIATLRGGGFIFGFDIFFCKFLGFLRLFIGTGGTGFFLGRGGGPMLFGRLVRLMLLKEGGLELNEGGLELDLLPLSTED